MRNLRKKNNKNKKEEKNEEKVKFQGERGTFTSGYSYHETDPYLKVGRRYFSIYDVLFRYGTNRDGAQQAVGWENILIPGTQIKTGTIRFVQRQKAMDKATENDITTKKLSDHLIASNQGASSEEDSREQARMRYRSADYSMARDLSGQEEPIIDTDIRLIISADSPELIEETYRLLKESYKERDVQGVQIVRRIGVQLDELRGLFVDISADNRHPSDMATTAAGRLFLPSSGFSDDSGVFLGYDTQSLLNQNPSIADVRGIRNAIVYTGGLRPYVSVDGSEPMLVESGGSVIADVLAEGNYFEGQRTHHIILTPDTGYENEARREGDSLYFDMTKTPINPFEVWGDNQTVILDANANFKKLRNMFMILMEQYGTEKGTSYGNTLEAELRNYFINVAHRYTRNPSKDPLRARQILASADHENYPNANEFLTSLVNLVGKASNSGTERDQDRARDLRDNIKLIFDTYPTVFSSSTSIPDVFKADTRNIYYDISKASTDKNLTAALLLNTLSYVSHRALEDEVIVIHGLDYANIPLDPLMDYRARMNRKNIGLITTFETNSKIVNPKTFSDFCGRFERQDFVVLGEVTQENLDSFSTLWGTNLPQAIQTNLINPQPGVFYFNRASDRTSALIQTILVR